MRPTVAHISLAALQANFQIVCDRAPHSKVAAVVKANAYGHGSAACAAALENHADALAVANIEEALALRDAGIRSPIILLEGHFQQNELSTAAQYSFWIMVHTEQQLNQVLAYSGAHRLTIWLKIDTGMHRLGLPPSVAEQSYKALQKCNHVEQTIVLASHFASAEAPNSEVTVQQIERLKSVNSAIGAPLSLANSAGILNHPTSHSDWVRPGIMLYGSSPAGLAESDKFLGLTPVMSLRSEVIALRDIDHGEGVGYGHHWTAKTPSTIATIAIGYADGYPRSAPSGTPVLVAGQLARLCGTVSMDMITVDVTELEEVRIGSKVELWGENLPAEEVAHVAGTLSYELFARMPARVPRQYE